jgi:hypothetical protein
MRRDEAVDAIRLLPLRLGPWLRFVVSRRAYRYVDEAELRARRRSDTVFVFGSGASLNELDASGWAHIAEHDTLGFNWWVHQRFVRTDYHLVRGIADSDRDPSVWRPQLEEYFRLIGESAFFDEAVLLIHTGFRAITGNRAVGLRLIPKRNPVFLWRTSIRVGAPSRAFAEGLTHGQSTIQEAINAAFLLGWRRIVLAGVDLYDRRYFWLPPHQTRELDRKRGATVADEHVQATMGLVRTLGAWREWLAGEGVELDVLNPRSLLADVLPVYAQLSQHQRSGR